VALLLFELIRWHLRKLIAWQRANRFVFSWQSKDAKVSSLQHENQGQAISNTHGRVGCNGFINWADFFLKMI
jgi:hypothetical protein